MSNLFISYQINDTEQDYELLKRAINTIGNMTQIHDTCWYVNSQMSAEDAIKRLGSVILKDSLLLVVDASNNLAHWIGVEPNKANRIKQNWLMDLSPVEEEAVN